MAPPVLIAPDDTRDSAKVIEDEDYNLPTMNAVSNEEIDQDEYVLPTADAHRHVHDANDGDSPDVVQGLYQNVTAGGDHADDVDGRGNAVHGQDATIVELDAWASDPEPPSHEASVEIEIHVPARGAVVPPPSPPPERESKTQDQAVVDVEADNTSTSTPAPAAAPAPPRFTLAQLRQKAMQEDVAKTLEVLAQHKTAAGGSGPVDRDARGSQLHRTPSLDERRALMHAQSARALKNPGAQPPIQQSQLRRAPSIEERKALMEAQSARALSDEHRKQGDVDSDEDIPMIINSAYGSLSDLHDTVLPTEGLDDPDVDSSADEG